MPGFKRSIVINRPIDQVFDFATDLNNAPVLLPGVTKTEMLTEGGPAAGAKFRETRGVKGKERTAIIEVVEHRRPQVHAACEACLGMKATYPFRFATEGSDTRVDMDADVQGNLLGKLFLGMLSRMMEREDGDYLTRLQSAMKRPEQA